MVCALPENALAIVCGVASHAKSPSAPTTACQTDVASPHPPPPRIHSGALTVFVSRDGEVLTARFLCARTTAMVTECASMEHVLASRAMRVFLARSACTLLSACAQTDALTIALVSARVLSTLRDKMPGASAMFLARDCATTDALSATTSFLHIQDLVTLLSAS